ncbi:pilus assembly protein [Mesorhizobium sp. M1D.F.Ca.ET.184.01.1.1]|nr:pilus assembly protein [Mesorhizobium sp. M1D.F.Ca.ET.231.01.1.1]TGP31282.1 pilus assembly protein [Mesorhizobium sp. M1D.F.Ca.ET.234.01.1.1]TGS45584.1 pilus assembly protein [Mesorhizobium sp. M1D.F.Ca.ET.184.01.1.1]TGS61059.1 pilus assembly protein [Mesorhizobium sp. M1D.F.Ca.ET.183.01.1.1]
MLKNRKFLAPWFRFRADAAGTSAVEFAMLAPIFILLLLGMVAYGIYFGASHSVQQIAADAARTAIAGLNQTERQALVTDFITHDVAGYPFVDPKKLTVDAKDSAVDGSQFVVSVSYDARNLPIWNLFRTLPLPGTTIQRQSTIRVGGI